MQSKNIPMAWRFSIRSLLLLVALICIVLAYVCPGIDAAKQEAISARAIEASGGWVSDSDPYHEGGPGEFIEGLFGRHFFHPIVEAEVCRRSDVKHVSSFRHLLQLRINAKVNDEDLTTLTSLPQLFELDISDSSVSDEGLKTIAQLPKLERLNLINCDITDQGIKHLNLSTLKTLFIKGTKVSPEFREQLESQTDIEIY